MGKRAHNMDPSFQTVRLSRGKHPSPQEGACVMELASMLAGRTFSDSVACVDPAIGGFLRGYNDHLSDELRQDLYRYAARVLDTRGDAELASRRAAMCRTWAHRARSLRTRRLVLLRGTHVRVLWSLRFQRRGRLDLVDCELAGAYAASMASSDRAWHTWTLGFIDTLCRVGSADLAIPELPESSVPAEMSKRPREVEVARHAERAPA